MAFRYTNGRVLDVGALSRVQEGVCVLLPVPGRAGQLGSADHHQRLV